MKKITFLLLMVFSIQTYAQIGSCIGATTLIPAHDFNAGAVTGSFLDSSNDWTQPNNCNDFVHYDVWYKVMVPPSGNLQVETDYADSNTATNTVLSFYTTDNCTSMTYIGCTDNKTEFDFMSWYYLYDYTPYTWVYIIVQRVGSTPLTATNCNFKIAAYDASILAPPSNNNCSGAATMPVAASFSAGAQTKTFLGATTTSGLAPDCTDHAFNDVWFKAVVPATGNITVETKTAATNSETDTVLTVYSGNCSSLVQIACNDDKSDTDSMSLVNLTGLLPGSTVYIAVWRYYIDMPVVADSSFQLAVYDSAAGPANDNCSGAITLIPAYNYAAGEVNTNMLNGTKSTGITVPCAANTSTDVWFKLIVPPSGNVTIETKQISPNPLTDTVITAYSGTCSALTLVGCNNDKSSSDMMSLLTVTGQVPGSTLYVMVAKNGTVPASPTLNHFFISAYDISTSPANDECSGAIALPIRNNFAQAATPATMLFATSTGGPPCDTLSFGFDVWYKVTVPASGSLTIETRVANSNSATDTAVAAYSGNCGAMTLAGCDNDGGAFGVNDKMSVLSLDGLTPGSILRIFVSEDSAGNWNNSGDCNFLIGVYDPSIPLSADTFDDTDFSAYPNPVQNILNLTYGKEISKVAVFSLLGQEVIAKTINSIETQIDMSALASGIYLVKVTSDNQVKTIKVVKK